MRETDVLNPDKMREQCQAAISGLEKENDTLNAVAEGLSQFIESDINSESFNGLKQQVSDYFTLITMLQMANSYDIADYSFLKSSVGDELLSGEIIVPAKESNYASMLEAQELSEEYREKAQTNSNPFLSGYYSSKASDWGVQMMLYQTAWQYWKGLEEKYDDVENRTSHLPGAGEAIRATAKDAILSVADSFRGGVYVPDMNASWRGEINGMAEIALRKTLPETVQRLSNKSLDEMTAGEREIYMTLVDMLVSGKLTDEEMTTVVSAYYVEYKSLTAPAHWKKGAQELSYTIDTYLRGKSALGLTSELDLQRGMIVMAALSVQEMYKPGKISYDKETQTYIYKYTAGEYSSGNNVYYRSAGEKTIEVGAAQRGADAGQKLDRESDELVGQMLGFDISDEISGIARDMVIDKFLESAFRTGLKTSATVAGLATGGIGTISSVWIDYVEAEETAGKIENILKIDNDANTMHFLDLYVVTATDGERYLKKVYPSERTEKFMKGYNKILGKENAIRPEDIYEKPEEVLEKLNSLDYSIRDEIRHGKSEV